MRLRLASLLYNTVDNVNPTLQATTGYDHIASGHGLISSATA